MNPNYLAQTLSTTGNTDFTTSSCALPLKTTRRIHATRRFHGLGRENVPAVLALLQTISWGTNVLALENSQFMCVSLVFFIV